MLNFCSIVAAILKMATGRNYSMSGINSGHHYLPTYQILMISDNVEFLPPIFIPYFGSHFENGRYLENFEWKRRIAPLMVTYHYVKIYGGSIYFFLKFQYFFCRYVPPGKRNQFNPQRNRHVPPNTNMPVRMPVHQPPPQPTAPRLAAQHSREEVKINGNGRFIELNIFSFRRRSYCNQNCIA